MIPREFWPELWHDLQENKEELEDIIKQNQKEIEEKKQQARKAKGSEFEDAMHQRKQKALKIHGHNYRERKKNKSNL